MYRDGSKAKELHQVLVVIFALELQYLMFSAIPSII